MRYWIVLAMVLLVACGSEESIEPEAPIPTEKIVVPEVNEEVKEIEEVEPEPEVKETQPFQIPDTVLTDVSCSGDALTFTITNTLEKTLTFGALSFPAPPDKQRIFVTINNLDPRNPDEFFTERSLRDCMPEELVPGESYTCVVSPIPIITPNPYSSNTILVQSVKVREQAGFEC